MNDRPPRKPPGSPPSFSEVIGAKTERKRRARRHRAAGVWFGLGMMGLIGWSVVVPTLVGALVGLWLDKHHPGARPWTLGLMLAGLVIGCANAWRWVRKEDQAMRDEQEDDHD